MMRLGMMDSRTMENPDYRLADNGDWGHGRCELLMMCIANDGAVDNGHDG